MGCGHRTPQTPGCSCEEVLLELSWLEGSVPAGSPEEELEEAPGKAHEWGGCQLSTGPEHVVSTGTAPTLPIPGSCQGLFSWRCGAVPLQGYGAPCLGVTELHSLLRGNAQSRAGATQTHVGRGGHSLPSCSLQETRPEEFFTSGSSDAFLNYFLSRQSSFTVL